MKGYGKTVGRPNFRKVLKRHRPPESSMYGVDWDLVSDFVRRRDGYRCMVHRISNFRCDGVYPPPFQHLLHAHHIVPLPRGSNHPTNLISLCKECHGKIHGKNLGSITNSQKAAAKRRSTIR